MSPRVLGIVVGIVSLIWAGLFTWTEVIDASPTEFSINSPEMKQRMSNCSGNFEQRQLCAEGIAEELQQRGFLVWCKKVALILGPPLVLWGLMSLLNRRIDGAPAPARRPLPPRRLATGLPAAPRARMAEDEAGSPREPSLQPPPRPRGPEIPGETPVFTGGRRGPVRRRDR